MERSRRATSGRINDSLEGGRKDTEVNMKTKAEQQTYYY